MTGLGLYWFNYKLAFGFTFPNAHGEEKPCLWLKSRSSQQLFQEDEISSTRRKSKLLYIVNIKSFWNHKCAHALKGVTIRGLGSDKKLTNSHVTITDWERTCGLPDLCKKTQFLPQCVVIRLSHQDKIEYFTRDNCLSSQTLKFQPLTVLFF